MTYVTRSPVLDINNVGVSSMRTPAYTIMSESSSGESSSSSENLTRYTLRYYYGYYAFDQTKSLINEALENSWISYKNQKHRQRIWADLGSQYVINRVYYENYHDSKSPTVFGTSTQAGSRYDGAYEGSLWGSNNKPETAYGTYEGMTKLWEGRFIIHSNNNASDPHTEIVFNHNTTPYQYYTIDILNNHSGNFGIGFRRLELQEQVSSSSSSTSISTSSSTSSSSM